MLTHMSQSARFTGLGLCVCVMALPVVASIVYVLYGQQKVIGEGKSREKRTNSIRSKTNEVGLLYPKLYPCL